MSPETVLLDELPTDDNPFDGASDLDGKTPCPECGEYFKSRGLSRHLNSAHGIEPERKQGGNKSKGTGAFATQWAEFQRGAALMVSFACTACAAVLIEDANTDGQAIASFCETRPKLKKQLQQALNSMDIMILVGALGGTARKMVSHHSIGQRIGLGDSSEHTHTPVSGGAAEKMMGFLTQMPEADRNQLLNQVFSGVATANTKTPAAATPKVTVVMDDEVPGQPPVPQPDTLTDQDKFQMAMAHSPTGDFVEAGLGE